MQMEKDFNIRTKCIQNSKDETCSIAGLYDLGETLGSGHFAIVKLARHVFTGAKVAVKVVDKTKLDDVSKAHLFHEVRCMKLVQHPNVVRLYEVIDTQAKLYLVLELGDGGDLYDYIMKHEGGLSEKLARKYFRQILRAISYCHQLHVVHRDLKPENVVFFEKLGVVKLTDFGFSNKFTPGKKLETFCGSLAYSAPEILLGDSYDAPAVDIWSLGVILYMLVCGQPPFEKANDSETLTMIMDCSYIVPSRISKNCKSLIGSMLVRDPKKRASLQEISIHPWLLDQSDAEESTNILPLSNFYELTEDDRAFVIQKMIHGNIAPKDEILLALDKNTYNHITATFFLLAEMRVRNREALQNTIRNTSQKSLTSENIDITKKQFQHKSAFTIEHSVPVPLIRKKTQLLESTAEKNNTRYRKCSIVREEEEEDLVNLNVKHPHELNSSTHHESLSDCELSRSLDDLNVAVSARLKSRESRRAENLLNLSEQRKRHLVNKDNELHLANLDINTIKSFPLSTSNTIISRRHNSFCTSNTFNDDGLPCRKY